MKMSRRTTLAKSPAFRFYPSDFIGSPTVQAMDLHEIGAYLLLLCTAWNAERHGYLPDDENLLRRWARMTKEQWEESRGLLLAKFPVMESGWRANPRMVSEAEKQRLFSEAQSEKGKKGGRPPKKPGVSEEKPGVFIIKPEESRMKAEKKPSVFVSAFVSVSEEQPQKQKQKPSRAKKPREGLYEAVKDLVFRYYRSKNGVDPEWNGREGKALAMLLDANPNAPMDHWTRCLTNRFHSEVSHGDRPGMWLGNLSSFSVPLNKFGKPLNGGSNGFKGKSGSSVDAARDAIAEIIAEAGGNYLDADSVRHSATIEAGQGGLQGLRIGPGAARVERH
jgi:uncharacterized protein YdaU (DUF1376 family)